MINYHFAIFGISATCQDWNSCTLNLDSGQDQIFQRKWEHIKEEESEGIRGNGAPLSRWIRGKRLEYRNCPDDKWCVFSGEQELYLTSEGNQEAPCERKSLKVLPNLFSIINEQMRNISSVYRTCILQMFWAVISKRVKITKGFGIGLWGEGLSPIPSRV